MCPRQVGDLIRLILEEAHYSRYSIHSGAAKMYHDLSQQPAAWGCISKDAYSYLEVGADYYGLCCGFAYHNGWL